MVAAPSAIAEQLVLAGRGRYRVGAEPTLRVDEHNGPMPDVLVTPRNASISPISADLVVEVSDTSLDYDRTSERALYSAVREYWVVDLQHEHVERYLPANADSPTSYDRTKRFRRMPIPMSRSTSKPFLRRHAKAGVNRSSLLRKRTAA